MYPNHVKPIESETILVPVDLTPLSLPTTLLAARMAQYENKRIRLLHLLPNTLTFSANRKNTLRNERYAQLRELAHKVVLKMGVCIETEMREGSIYHQIAYAALEQNDSFMVMGTHGLQGAQMLWGSKALKVVRSADRPFFIADAHTSIPASLQRIVYPVDHRPESKQALAWLTKLGKQHKARIHLVSRAGNTEFENAIRLNTGYLEHHLNQAGVLVKNHLVFQPIPFAEGILIIAQKEQCQLLVAITQDTALSPWLSAQTALEQQVMFNKLSIPTLMIHAFDGNIITDSTTGLTSPV